MVPYHQDPEHVAPLHEAPRCQHIRMNGRRCGSPALRGESYCYFHNCVEDTRRDYSLPFPEDATSLQYGVMMVIRMLISGHVEYKRCWLLLYSLQIANSNLQAFAAERAEREGVASEKMAGKPRVAGHQKSRGDLDAQSLAGLLRGLLAAVGSNEQPPIIRAPEDCAAMERKPAAAALPEPGGKNVKQSRIGGVPRPPL